MNIPPAQEPSRMPEPIRNVGENIGNAVEQAKTGFNDAVSGFSNQAAAGITTTSSSVQAFLQSNTIIAKFAFLILIIIGFLILFTLGISLLQYFLTPPANPYLIYGQSDANVSKIIPGDPKQSNFSQISRSNNQSTGLEFTWSIWIMINGLGTGTTYQHIFNKGDATYTGKDGAGVSGLASVNNGPGLYLAPPGYTYTNQDGTFSPNSNILVRDTNAADPNMAILHIVMNTSNNTDANNVLNIPNIPLRQWVNVAVRMENTIMDVYINGIVTNRLVLPQVPKQNYNDVNVCMNNGFSGKISNLRYYQYALNAFEINSIVYGGPNTTTTVADTKNSGNYTYLSNSWYASKMQ